ncbi:primosomal protein, partial [Cryobacterium sp. TMB1-7]
RDGDRPPYRGNSDRPAYQGNSDRPQRDGDRPPYRGNSDRPAYKGNSDRPQRDGDRPPYRGNSDRPAYNSDRPAYKGNSDRPQRDGDRPPYRGNSDRPAYNSDRPAYKGNSDRPQRDGDRPAYKGNSDRPAYKGNSDRPQRDGDRPAYKGNSDRPAYKGNSDRPQRDGDRPAYKGNSDRPAYKGNSDRPQRDTENKPWLKDSARGGSPTRAGAPRDSGKKLWTREGAPARGDRDARVVEEEMTEEQRMQRELRSVRPRHDDPELPDDITSEDLDRIARNELKTLTKDNAEAVGRHLAMAARVIEEDPELAHRHVMSAARRAGRIAVVRESLAITAYATGDFALALRELRTYRRISGSNAQLPLMVDSERGVGRPDRALELGRSVDRSTLPAGVQVALAIAMSGARLDLGETEAALSELEIAQLDPKTAFSYSSELFAAYAEVLEELGRTDEADVWNERASRADAALNGDVDETIEIVELDEEFDEDEDEDEDADQDEDESDQDNADTPDELETADDTITISDTETDTEDAASSDDESHDDAKGVDEDPETTPVD